MSRGRNGLAAVLGKPGICYLAAVAVIGVMNALDVFDHETMFYLCLTATLPMSLFTPALLFHVVAPLLHVLRMPDPAVQFLVDFGYAFVGGVLNVLLFLGARALAREWCSAQRAARAARAAR
ncbi:hypothetical protein [Streptomyces sp. HB2AG]|uniref:hypothetical protein n=1 Tax=Streptomyces sp. HB2AG TaxID=2983400 RepID=UPI0022AAA413|nr:hypothetical protein [Streptomyces sp. HB2AG]MCZ2527340.1 hypothetical protein [Streptomyces sp. HB2AG]